MAFTPTDGAVLISATQSDVDVVATVQFAPLPPEVLDTLEWVTDLPENAVVSVDGDTLTVSIDSLEDLFPVESIQYLLAGELGECFTWGDLPEAAEQIISYRPSGVSLRTYSLLVEAVTDLSTEAAEYTITVTANYDTGKLLLVEAVNARRD